MSLFSPHQDLSVLILLVTSLFQPPLLAVLLGTLSRSSPALSTITILFGNFSGCYTHCSLACVFFESPYPSLAPSPSDSPSFHPFHLPSFSLSPFLPTSLPPFLPPSLSLSLPLSLSGARPDQQRAQAAPAGGALSGVCPATGGPVPGQDGLRQEETAHTTVALCYHTPFCHHI